MATPYKIAYSMEEKAKIQKELEDLMRKMKTEKSHKIKVTHKIVKYKHQWEFYVVPK